MPVVEFAPDESTTRAALQLLDEAVTVDRDGRHNRLLRGLRQLEDPALAPLFAGLSDAASHPSLQVHGILGLAEIARPRGLMAAEVAAVQRPDVQAELIGAALDSDLIDQPTRLMLLGWEGLTPGVKLLLAMPLVAEGRLDRESEGHAALLEAMTDPSPGQRGLAALLLHQLGDPQGTQGLIALNQDTSPSRDAVRATLLETAARHNLDRARTWAYSVAREGDLAPRLEMLALETAIRFGDPRARSWWSHLVQDSQEVSRTTRLALAGMDVSAWMEPERFDGLVASDDPFIAQVAGVAKAVARAHAGQPGPAVERAIAGLVMTGHPQVCRWAEDYTRLTASDSVAAAIAAAIITHYTPGQERGRARRLDAVVWSTRTLLERAPADAAALLREALSRPEADPGWCRAVLLGLIRSRAAAVADLSRDLPEFADRDAADLALNLRLRQPEPLTGAGQQALALQIRGGTNLDDSLRVQAAWAYLKRTGQGPEAIRALLAP